MALVLNRCVLNDALDIGHRGAASDVRIPELVRRPVDEVLGVLRRRQPACSLKNHAAVQRLGQHLERRDAAAVSLLHKAKLNLADDQRLAVSVRARPESHLSRLELQVEVAPRQLGKDRRVVAVHPLQRLFDEVRGVAHLVRLGVLLLEVCAKVK